MENNGQKPDKFLMALLAAAGLAIVLCAWLKPLGMADRIIAGLVGSAGLLGPVTRVLVGRTRQPRPVIVTDNTEDGEQTDHQQVKQPGASPPVFACKK